MRDGPQELNIKENETSSAYRTYEPTAFEKKGPTRCIVLAQSSLAREDALGIVPLKWVTQVAPVHEIPHAGRRASPQSSRVPGKLYYVNKYYWGPLS